MWLDLRDNYLTRIPKTIELHKSLSHLLLKNNKITSLPDELGTVRTLQVLQLSGNPLEYPPKEVVDGGVSKIVNYLHDKYLEEIFTRSQLDSLEDEAGIIGNYQEAISYNSVVELEKDNPKTLSVQVNGKLSDESDEESSKGNVKCHKLPKSRSKTLPPFCQSSKYVKPLRAASYSEQNDKIKRSYFKEKALNKHADLMTTVDKILQGRKYVSYILKMFCIRS